MFYITLLSGELSLEKYSEYDIEEIYSKGWRKVQVYANDLLCYWAVREPGKSININRYSKLFTYLWSWGRPLVLQF